MSLHQAFGLLLLWPATLFSTSIGGPAAKTLASSKIARWDLATKPFASSW